jgi:predicted DCC family thiol-disulfide oxidoreductase YuxK
MKDKSREDKLALIALLATSSCMAMGLLFYAMFGNRIIESIYRGESLDFLNRLMERHRMSRPWGSLEHYLTLGRLLFSRIFITCVAAQLLIVAILKYRRILGVIEEIFTAVSHPINLAVFRVLLFYSIFESVDVSSIVWFSQVPAELRVVPIGLGWLTDYLPINPRWAQVSSTLLLLCSFTGMIGFFTRTSALLTAVLGCYALGIPQLYGKVNHYHHLLWFSAILAASRCGDAFSCDAVVAAWRKADRGLIDFPVASQIYALPLRFVWLLLGILYFFAGFWKFWSGGVDWALSENLKFIMYQKWSELGNWEPIFRIDRYPLLYKSAAAATILFEMSFIFLVFSKKLRLLAPLGGFMFHTGSDLFMRIGFTTLVRSYVVFFDWHAVFGRIGRWLYRDEMVVLYDGNCKLCRRTLATLRVFDVFRRVAYVNALDQDAVKERELGWLESSALMKDMHVVVRSTKWTGFAAYRALASRIPLLWPALPFLYLWPIPAIGSWIYRRVADSRTCRIAQPTFRAEVGRKADGAVAGIMAVGGFLVLGNLFMSVGNIGYAWPLAAYPSFEGIAGPKTDSIEILVVSSTGGMIPLNAEQSIWQELQKTRFLGLVGQILSAKTDEQRRIRLMALWRLWAAGDSMVRQADAIRFYRVTVWTIPERRGENPIQRDLVFEAKLQNL